VKIRSSIRPKALTKVAVASAAAAGVSQVAARATDTVMLAAESLLPDVAPAVSAPGLSALQKIAQGPGLGLAAGALTGLGIAFGAVWGQQLVDLSRSSLWKRIVIKPAADTYNQGIKFRQSVGEARAEESSGEAFRKGAAAGWDVGASLGRSAGTVQGGVTGAILGLEYSGEALTWLQSVIESTPLPPLLQQSLPLLVGGACLFAGQAVGSAVGGAVGSVVGGGVVGLGVGTYAAVAQNRVPDEPR
jgi:hypothetical protein